MGGTGGLYLWIEGLDDERFIDSVFTECRRAVLICNDSKISWPEDGQDSLVLEIHCRYGRRCSVLWRS